jgi:hypothetical protein
VTHTPPEPNDKAEEESSPKPKPKKPPGYRNVEKVLKQVVNAHPLRKAKLEQRPHVAQ